jgi:hypothetical protein
MFALLGHLVVIHVCSCFWRNVRRGPMPCPILQPICLRILAPTESDGGGNSAASSFLAIELNRFDPIRAEINPVTHDSLVIVIGTRRARCSRGEV